MVVGALGELVFEVTEQTVRTADNLTWSGSARYAAHERHNWHALEEFTGINPDRISLTVYLSRHLGADVMGEIVKLWKYEREGTPVSLVLGDHGYGKYRWVIEKHSTDLETFDHAGKLEACTVKLELLEYMKD